MIDLNEYRQPVVNPGIDGEGHVTELDSKHKALLVMGISHHEIHEGESFTVDHIESGTGFSLCFKVPEGTTRVHMVLSWATEDAGEIQLWEGRTWDASSGVGKPIYNRDRNSLNPSQILEDMSTGEFIANHSIILNPTGLAGGLDIENHRTWSNKQQTDRARGTSEFILKNDETYAVTFVSNAQSKGAQIELSWYEHLDK